MPHLLTASAQDRSRGAGAPASADTFQLVASPIRGWTHPRDDAASAPGDLVAPDIHSFRDLVVGRSACVRRVLPRATRLPHHQAAPDRGAADSRRAPDRAACGHAGASDSHRHWTAHAKNSPGGLLRLRSARSAGTAGRGPSTEPRKDREMSVNVSGAAGARDTYRGASPSTATRIVGPCRPEATRRRARTSVSPTPAWPPGPTPRA